MHTCKKCVLSMDLCKSIMRANISFNKIMNTEFGSYLIKYNHTDIPCETTRRKMYLIEFYEETIDKIRKHVAKNKIRVLIDESIYVEGRFIVGNLKFEIDCHNCWNIIV
jgi:hypothetical protein